MKVNICGIKHEVIETKDEFNVDCHFGQINYKDCVIKINKDMSQEMKDETLCHEIMHGILVHLGYNNLANDEQFVQAIGNAVYQSFAILKIKTKEDRRNKYIDSPNISESDIDKVLEYIGRNNKRIMEGE